MTKTRDKSGKFAHRFSFVKNDFIAKYNELNSARKMGEYYGCDKSTILNYAKKIGYVNHYRFEPTEEQIEYINTNYSTKTSGQLAHEIGCSKSFVLNTWRNNNLLGKTPRVYSLLNEDFFEQIDCPNKAYFVGMLAADGCVYKRKKLEEANRSYQISLSIKNEDSYVLEALNKCLGSNKPIKTTKRKLATSKGEHPEYASLAIVSNKIAKDLSKFKIVPQKTQLVFDLSAIPQEFLKDYFRGYFDGDGSIDKNGSRARIVGFKDNLINMQNILESCGILYKFNPDKREYSFKEFGELGPLNKEENLKFLQWIYQDSEIYLTRKKERADIFIQKHQNIIKENK